jgi:glyoxylate/hydroxypyruvate reductase
MLFSSIARGTPTLLRQGLKSSFHSSAFVGGKKVLATRLLLKESQERLEKQGFDLIQWPQDSSMPRETLLKDIKGTCF